MSLEQTFAELEAAIQKLEEDDISLEDSFTVYNKGMQLLKNCNDAIDKVEKQVLKINETGELAPFEE